MTNTQKTVAQGAESLINLGKSKRLAAMRESINMRVDKEKVVAQKHFGAKNKEREIYQARIAIQKSITEIKATYSQGRQNKLFALRYGSEEKINQMGLQQLFSACTNKPFFEKYHTIFMEYFLNFNSAPQKNHQFLRIA